MKAFDEGMLAGLEMAAVILSESLSDDYCESCKSPWKYDHGQDDWVNPFQLLREAAQAIEARRAATTKIGAVHESAVANGDAPKGD